MAAPVSQDASDHIVTPAGALGFLVAEDAVDRYFITRIESWTHHVCSILRYEIRKTVSFVVGHR